jgi:hypothetical protein
MPKGDSGSIVIKGKTVGSYTATECLLGSCGKYEVNDADGNLIFSVAHMHYEDPDMRSNGNPQGNVNYYEWTFYKTATKVETDFIFRSKKFVEYLETNRIFDENGLSEQGVKNFALKHGTKHADKRSRTIHVR